MWMLRWLTLVATAGMITVNVLANALPINGKTTGDISNGFDIPFTPAGYVFSIWGLIYLGVVVFSIVQALPSRQRSSTITAVRPWYLLNATANAAWIFAWHHEFFGLSLGIMLVLLGSLVTIYRHVGGESNVRSVSFWTVRAPFSLYFGWICIATIANVTVVSWSAGAVELVSHPAFTLALLVAATGVCAAIALPRADPVFAGVFVWAIFGIAMANEGSVVLFAGALIFTGLCAVVAVVSTLAAVRRARSDTAVSMV
jgi:hypothetical protein